MDNHDCMHGYFAKAHHGRDNWIAHSTQIGTDLDRLQVPVLATTNDLLLNNRIAFSLYIVGQIFGLFWRNKGRQ